MKTAFARLILAAGLATATAGCGQKGALYLPGDPSTIQTEIPSQPEPVPGESAGRPDAGQDNEADQER